VTYRIVQTGPNTTLGGLKAGLFRPTYHVETLDAVARPPMAPTARAMATEPMAEARPLGAPGTVDWLVIFRSLHEASVCAST